MPGDTQIVSPDAEAETAALMVLKGDCPLFPVESLPLMASTWITLPKKGGVDIRCDMIFLRISQVMYQPDPNLMKVDEP